jgi:hypothetical protein
MSRGLGRLERTIAAIIARQRQARQRIRVEAIEVAYEAREAGGTNWDARSRLVAARRAMHSYARKDPNLTLFRTGLGSLILAPRRGDIARQFAHVAARKAERGKRG